MTEMTYEPKPINTADVKLSSDLRDLTELLAANAHDHWAAGRIKTGWEFGPKRDDELKQHPDLIPYNELSSSEQDYDRTTAMETIKAIILLGYTIERSDTMTRSSKSTR